MKLMLKYVQYLYFSMNIFNNNEIIFELNFHFDDILFLHTFQFFFMDCVLINFKTYT